MASPVIFDDGGSTRIKQLQDDANMDGLLGIPGPAPGTTVFQALADGRFVDGAGNFKCLMKVRIHQLDGDQQIFPPPVGGGGSGVDLQQPDTIIIVSQNGQIATLTFDAVTFRMLIQLTSPPAVAGILSPIVEAKQNKRQRRYVVTNAGAIQTVNLVRGGVTTVIFDLAVNPSIYTMVHFH